MSRNLVSDDDRADMDYAASAFARELGEVLGELKDAASENVANHRDEIVAELSGLKDALADIGSAIERIGDQLANLKDELRYKS
jgi:hypothetical protein